MSLCKICVECVSMNAYCVRYCPMDVQCSPVRPYAYSSSSSTSWQIIITIQICCSSVRKRRAKWFVLLSWNWHNIGLSGPMNLNTLTHIRIVNGDDDLMHSEFQFLMWDSELAISNIDGLRCQSKLRRIAIDEYQLFLKYFVWFRMIIKMVSWNLAVSGIIKYNFI